MFDEFKALAMLDEFKALADTNANYRCCIINMRATCDPTVTLDAEQWGQAIKKAVEISWYDAIGGGVDNGQLYGMMPDVAVMSTMPAGDVCSARLVAVIAGLNHAELAAVLDYCHQTAAFDWHPDPAVYADGGGVNLRLEWSLAHVSRPSRMSASAMGTK